MAHAILTVTCSGGTYFDRDHYVDVHLPLALACWQPHGLESASAFFPRDADAADVSVGIYRFRDEDALHAALASAETAEVMADVPRCTDATVSRTVGTTL
ncbi:EthD family reductase [Sphingomonas sp. Sphisp140]|uniref:EthD family reductase n=1 Tax=unclassified Sphingomonas TaxID=196159 RepID=UPI0039AEE73B